MRRGWRSSWHCTRGGQLKTYEGKPCKYGHGTTRWKSTRGCTTCSNISANKWAAENKERATARKRRWYSENRLKQRSTAAARKYGLALGEYERRVAAQSGACAICGRIPEDALQVDHDHTTKRLRDLLCRHCNSGLGQFNDSVDNMRNAIDYIKRHKT